MPLSELVLYCTLTHRANKIITINYRLREPNIEFSFQNHHSFHKFRRRISPMS